MAILPVMWAWGIKGIICIYHWARAHRSSVAYRFHSDDVFVLRTVMRLAACRYQATGVRHACRRIAKYGKLHAMSADPVYDRDKLYEEVWADPVTVVAKRYGVSDVAIHKACKRLKVPVPPRGYWAKLRAGHTVTREPLPPTEGSSRCSGTSSARPRRQPVMDPTTRLGYLPEDERAKILAICTTVKVADRLTNPHALIEQDRQAHEELKQWERESKKSARGSIGYLTPSPPYPYHLIEKMLRIPGPDDIQPRVYRLLNTLFHTIESCGGSVRLEPQKRHLHVTLLGEPMEIRLKAQEDGLSLVIDEYYAPRKNWRDTKHKKVEDEIGSFVLGLLDCAAILRDLREKREREEQQRRLAEQQRRERARKQQQELIRYQALEHTAMDWHKARILEGYLTALEQQAASETDEQKRSAMLRKLAWGKEKLAWLDPLISRQDPILGKRQYQLPEDKKVDIEQLRTPSMVWW